MNGISVREPVNKLKFIHATENYMAFKKNESDVHVSTCMNLKNIIMNKKASFKGIYTT